MDKDVIIKFLTDNGWQLDEWGHLQRTVNLSKEGSIIQRHYRIKIQATSCRIEIRYNIMGKNEWVRVGGAYYKDVRYYEEGRLLIGTFVFHQKSNPNPVGSATGFGSS